MMSPDDNIKNSTKTRDDDTKYMKEAARWIHAKPQSNQSPTSSTSRLSSLTTKLKSLVLSKSKQDSTENIGPTFHHFSLLPNELQVQIWTYAAQAPLIHKTNYGIISSHRLTPSSTSTSTTAPPDSDSIANPPPTKPTFQVPPPQTFSSKTLSPFFSLSDPIPSSNPSNKIFFPIVPLLHTCSLSRHIFQKEWEPRLPEHLRGIIGRTGRKEGYCWGKEEAWMSEG
ncbi:hypothetical protein BKA64DRAFT_750992 [Cadophora sp. MPI-SDFR-AT-0126]|nr:hypothetical protein BKA64DRAFT_750992 [Leotiomycetes sp. MPI-SDFR-AT-0126]